MAVRKKTSTFPQVWNIPYRRNPFFTGREDILKSIHAMLTADKAAALSQPPAISGLGGIGKTQTAVEYAYRYRDNYQFVLWVQANTRETLVSDFMVIAHQLNLAEKNVQDQKRVVNVVKNWLEENTQWLLILDNADDLRMISNFLPVGALGHVLLTTSANAMGDIALRIEIEEMEPEEGALFLLRRAKIIATDAPFSNASEADRTSAKTISEEMDGLPLALDQAGAYIEETVCGLSGYLHLYQTYRAKLLKQRGGVAPTHPESVATTFSLAFEKVQQVNPAATRLLKLCAFLAPDAIPEELILEGPSDLDADLQSLVGNPHELNEAVKALLKFSLVRRDVKVHTLTVHRLVQAVLKDEIEKQTHLQWAEIAVRAVSQVFPVSEFATWPRCQRYLPHALVCIEYVKQWSITFPEAARLLNRAGDYLEARTQYREAQFLLQQALAICEQVLGSEHPDTATSLNSLAGLYLSQGKYEQAEPLYQRALAIREQVLGTEHPDTATSLNDLAMLYRNQGKYEQAEPLYQRALAIREQMLEPEHPNIADSLNDLALLYKEQDKLEQAEPLLQRALTISKKVLGPEHPDTATNLHNLAMLYESQTKYEQAELHFQQALEIDKKVFGPEHPDTATTFHNLARFYVMQGKYEQAEPLLQQALVIDKRVFGSEHFYTANCVYDLALLYKRQGKLEQAELLYKQALVIYERARGPEHSDTLASLSNLADLYKEQGKYEQAEPLYQRALTISEKVQGPEHSDTAISLYKLADLYKEQGKYEQAEPLYQRVLAIREKVQGPEHIATATSLYKLADLYGSQGKYEQAEPLYQRALAIDEKAFGPEHPEVVTDLNGLASLYESQGKYEQAEPLYQRALTISEKVQGPEHTVTAKILRNYADLLWQTERDDEAEQMEVRAKSIQAKLSHSGERN